MNEDEVMEFIIGLKKFNSDLIDLNIKYAEEIERLKEEVKEWKHNATRINNENNKLHSIIKEVREYMVKYGNLYCLKHTQFKEYHQYKVILEILNKVGE